MYLEAVYYRSIATSLEPNREQGGITIILVDTHVKQYRCVKYV